MSALPVKSVGPQSGNLRPSEISQTNWDILAQAPVVSQGWERTKLPRSVANTAVTVAVETPRHLAFPGICQTRSGKILIVYRDGLTHAGGRQPTDGRLMMIASADAGRTWSEPWLVYDDPAVDDRNAALLCTAEGVVVLVWNKYYEGDDRGVFLATSGDEGVSWSAPVPIGTNPKLRTRNAPIEVRTLGSGSEWLIPLYDCMSDVKAAYLGIYHPADGAVEVVPVTPPGERNISDEWALAQAADGHLVGLIRSNWDPVLWQTESYDGGRTWIDLRKSVIPSQFTPPDLIRLHDGRLLVTFSFRERCDERQVISEDNGQTWQVASGIDVYDATLRGDRSYPAAVQLDAGTVGTVIYETRNAPQGGRILFARTQLAELSRPAISAWHSEAAAESLLMYELPQKSTAGKVLVVEADYRFTGKFGEPLNGVELLLAADTGDSVRIGYWMGGGREATNLIRIALQQEGDEQVLYNAAATGDWFNDGNNHLLRVTYVAGEITMTIDGIAQAKIHLPGAAQAFVPARLGVTARKAAVALFTLRAGIAE